MTLGEFNLYLDGYNRRKKSELKTAVITGFYSAYFTNSKHPKKLDAVLKQFDKGSAEVKQAEPVDIETAKAMDAKIQSGEWLLKPI